jgi:hypothetical protein
MKTIMVSNPFISIYDVWILTHTTTHANAFYEHAKNRPSKRADRWGSKLLTQEGSQRSAWEFQRMKVLNILDIKPFKHHEDSANPYNHQPTIYRY